MRCFLRSALFLSFPFIFLLHHAGGDTETEMDKEQKSPGGRQVSPIDDMFSYVGLLLS